MGCVRPIIHSFRTLTYWFYLGIYFILFGWSAWIITCFGGLQGERERTTAEWAGLTRERERCLFMSLSQQKRSICFQGTMEIITSGRNFQLHLPSCLLCFLGSSTLSRKWICSYEIRERLHLHSTPTIHILHSWKLTWFWQLCIYL